MKPSLIFVFILNLFYIVNSLMNNSVLAKFITDVSISKKIQFLIVFVCFRRHDTIQLVKIIAKSYAPLKIVILDSFEEKLYNKIKEKINLGFVLDLSCNRSQKVLSMAESHSLYESQFKWVIIDPYHRVIKNHSSIASFFENISLRIDSDVTLAIFDSESISFTLFDVYKPGIHNKNNAKVKQIGFWSEKNVVDIFKQAKYQERKNMTGTIVKCGVVKTRSDATRSIHEYYSQVTINNYDTINKLSYSLFVHIKEIHNFSAHVTVTGKWFGGLIGGMDEGLAQQLYQQQVDVGISAGLLKSDRIPFTDFVAPAYPFRTCFIFRNPGTSPKVQNQFLKPFESSLWLSIVASILLFCATLKTITFIQRLLSKPNFQDVSWIAAWLLTWAVFCQQGATFIPKPTSSRFAILNLLLMSLLLYNYYTSSIVSSLLSGLPPPFTTIEELAHSDMKVGMEDTVYIRTLFEVTKDPAIKFLYNQKILEEKDKPAYMKVSDGTGKIKDGGFAYHTEATTAYPLIRSTFEPYQICDLAEINLFKPTVLWIMTQKRSQYKKLFAIGYLKMWEAGIVSRQQSIWITKKPACLSSTHLVQVGIPPLLPAFLILLFGITVSIILLSLEFFMQKYRTRLI